MLRLFDCCQSEPKRLQVREQALLATLPMKCKEKCRRQSLGIFCLITWPSINSIISGLRSLSPSLRTVTCPVTVPLADAPASRPIRHNNAHLQRSECIIRARTRWPCHLPKGTPKSCEHTNSLKGSSTSRSPLGREASLLHPSLRRLTGKLQSAANCVKVLNVK